MQALGAPPSDLPPGDDYPTEYQGVPDGGYPGGQGGYGGGGYGTGGYGAGGYGDRPANRSGPLPPSRPGRSKFVDYTLKGLGLVGVALVSGFLWWLFRHNPNPSPQINGGDTQTAGVYQFTPYQDPTYDTNCVPHATDQVQTYLQGHHCVQLTRTLYTTSVGGQSVVTSVEVVKMGTAVAAAKLNSISQGNSTGHVKDPLEEGMVTVPGGPSNLENGGYYSEVHGTEVIIAVSEFTINSQDTTTNLNANKSLLDSVSKDAMRLGVGK